MAQAVRRSWSGAPLSSAWWMTPWNASSATARVRLPWCGEPGIGKTRMLAELEARAAAKGQIVLSGNASELESELPFWVFVDALDEYVQALEPSRLDSLDQQTLRRARPHPAVVLHSHRATPPAEQRDDRYRAHSAVCAAPGITGCAASRWCSFSTTSTGRTPGRSSCSGRCCAGRRRRRYCSRLPCGRASCPERLSAALERAASRRRSDPPRAGSPVPRRRLASSSARASTEPRRPRSTRRPAATPSISSSSPVPRVAPGMERRPPVGSPWPGSRCREPWPPR